MNKYKLLFERYVSILLQLNEAGEGKRKRKQRAQQVLDKDKPDLSAFEKLEDEPDLRTADELQAGKELAGKQKAGVGEVPDIDTGERASAEQTARAASAAAHRLATDPASAEARASAWEKFQQATAGAEDTVDVDTAELDDVYSDVDMEEREEIFYQLFGFRPANVPGFRPQPVDQPRFQPMALTRIERDVAKKQMPRFTSNVRWHQVRHLPGYLLKQIRAAFRPLFQQYMDAQLEEIEVATTLTSPVHDMQTLLGYLVASGQIFEDFQLEAFDIDPEIYHIEKAFMIKGVDGYTYMLLRERLGNATNYYAYRGKSKGPTKKLGGEWEK